jgi:hypothetical protein
MGSPVNLDNCQQRTRAPRGRAFRREGEPRQAANLRRNRERHGLAHLDHEPSFVPGILSILAKARVRQDPQPPDRQRPNTTSSLLGSYFWVASPGIHPRRLPQLAWRGFSRVPGRPPACAAVVEARGRTEVVGRRCRWRRWYKPPAAGIRQALRRLGTNELPASHHHWSQDEDSTLGVTTLCRWYTLDAATVPPRARSLVAHLADKACGRRLGSGQPQRAPGSDAVLTGARR